MLSTKQIESEEILVKGLFDDVVSHKGRID
jgi:hypothetical protein